MFKHPPRMFPLDAHEMTVPLLLMYYTNLFQAQRESPIFLKNSSAQIGRRLLPSTDVPSWPGAVLGSRAHKLDKKSNFPVGLLGSECSQTHCFFSGAVDFYSSWCKWADKGTVGTGVWPSCLLSHSGHVVLSFCHTDSVFFWVFFKQRTWQACLNFFSLSLLRREFITNVESCWIVMFLILFRVAESTTHLWTMLSLKTAGMLEWEWLW